MVIDLRSDTVTKPSAAMREAMANADVGDDVYGEDPTINSLEARVAHVFGKESGLFTPTGSMANQLGIRLLVNPGEELLAEEDAHVVRAELGAAAAHGGITTRTWRAARGALDAQTPLAMARPNAGPYLVSTKAIAVEDTHNFGAGTVQGIDQIKALYYGAQEMGISLHLDGARIWNACAATTIEPLEYGKYADTLSVCLSKGLGAPIGSVLIGTKDHIDQARHWRKVLGGGMRQAGILAAAGLHALENHRSTLQEDHQKAALFASLISRDSNCTIANSSGMVESNIVIIDCGDHISPVDIQNKCAEQALILSMSRGRCLRAVFHRDIPMDAIHTAAEIFCSSYHLLENANS